MMRIFLWKSFILKKLNLWELWKIVNCVKTSILSKVQNIRTHSILRAMFLILKHVDKENNEYPTNADYPDLTKQKKINQHSS